MILYIEAIVMQAFTVPVVLFFWFWSWAEMHCGIALMIGYHIQAGFSDIDASVCTLSNQPERNNSYDKQGR